MTAACGASGNLHWHSKSSVVQRTRNPPPVHPGAFEGSSLREARPRTSHTSPRELHPPDPDHTEEENRKAAHPGATRCTLGVLLTLDSQEETLSGRFNQAD